MGPRFREDDVGFCSLTLHFPISSAIPIGDKLPSNFKVRDVTVASTPQAR